MQVATHPYIISTYVHTCTNLFTDEFSENSHHKVNQFGMCSQGLDHLHTHIQGLRDIFRNMEFISTSLMYENKEYFISTWSSQNKSVHISAGCAKTQRNAITVLMKSTGIGEWSSSCCRTTANTSCVYTLFSEKQIFVAAEGTHDRSHYKHFPYEEKKQPLMAAFMSASSWEQSILCRAIRSSDGVTGLMLCPWSPANTKYIIVNFVDYI